MWKYDGIATERLARFDVEDVEPLSTNPFAEG